MLIISGAWQTPPVLLIVTGLLKGTYRIGLLLWLLYPFSSVHPYTLLWLYTQYPD